MTARQFAQYGAGTLALLLSVGCQQKMADQPVYGTLEPGKFFADGLSARPPVTGTIARGDLERYAHRLPGSAPAGTGVKAPPEMPALASPEEFVTEFPYPMTAEILKRGQERYQIYCALCHDGAGTGAGRIIQRGYVKPPSYHLERLRNAPVGYLFEVATNGRGAMPKYEAMIPVNDRWAIVAYVRALQLSQTARLDQLSPEEQKKLDAGGKP